MLGDVDVGHWGGGLLTAAAAGAGRATGSDTEGARGGPEATGEGGTKGSGAAVPAGGRVCCGVEHAGGDRDCRDDGDRDCRDDTLGGENELAVARGAADEDRVVAAAPAGWGGGVPGGVVSIPLSSIIVQLWDGREPRESLGGSR